MNAFLENLKRQAQENPMIAISAGATVVAAIGQLVKTIVISRNSRTWAKEVARRAAKEASKKR